MAPRRPTAPGSGTGRGGGRSVPGRPGSERPGSGAQGRGAPVRGGSTGRIGTGRAAAGAGSSDDPFPVPHRAGRPPREAGRGPGRRGRGRAGGTGRRAPVIRPVTMLAGVGVVLVILLAPYLRPWLAQRSDIAAKRAEVAALQQQVDQLTAERNRWNDANYIKAQARQRLNFVMPGELGYVVLEDGKRAPAQQDPAQQAAADAGKLTGRPWYDVLWQSVQLAGRPAATSATPGTTPGTTGGAAGSGTTPTP
jgi:cell division protein FtsB